VVYSGAPEGTAGLSNTILTIVVNSGAPEGTAGLSNTILTIVVNSGAPEGTAVHAPLGNTRHAILGKCYLLLLSYQHSLFELCPTDTHTSIFI
jgi:hypothetical protein